VSEAEVSDRGREQLAGWIRQLADIERPSATVGEQEAARWIVAQLSDAGVDARIETERADGTHLPFLLPSLVALLAGFPYQHRCTATAAGLATLAIADELEGGRRILRRALARRRTYNVVAELGDRGAGATVLFVAHHDVARPWAAPFGALVSAPPLPFLKGRPFPVLAALIYGPLLVFAGIASGQQQLKRAGMALCAFVAVLLSDISRRRPVPGANDNATGVAAVIALAHDLIDRQPRSVRVVLLSTGSEETMVEGMYAFLQRHRDDLDPARTLVVCLDQIGWERLVLRESEGVLRRYRSRDKDLDLVLDAARRAGVALEVAGPFPTPSDGLAARWRRIPTIFLGSVAANGGYPHYHRPTDLPEHVDIDSVSGARAICAQLVEQLDAPARAAAT
jgi:Peptidase family M28